MSSLKEWLRYLWKNEDGFFGIKQGPSNQQNKLLGGMTNLSNFAISEGERDILTSGDFMRALASGDPTAISRVLGPEISSINKQTQQQKKTTSEFGNRGGGTNATLQSLDETTLGQVRGLLASLTGSSVGALASEGSNLLTTGESAGATAFGEATTIQQERANKWKDIFKSIAEIAGGVGLGAGIKSGTPLGGIFGGLAGVGG